LPGPPVTSGFSEDDNFWLIFAAVLTAIILPFHIELMAASICSIVMQNSGSVGNEQQIAGRCS